MPGGSWRDGPGAGVANAHEVNGRAGLDGKVVLLRPTVVGDYRFLWVRQTFAEPGGRYSCRPCDIPLADLQIDLIYLDDRGRLRLRSTRLHFVSPGLWESGPVNILDYWLEGYVEHHFRLFCEEGRAVLRHGVGPVGDDGHHPVEADFREVLFFSCVPFRYDFVFNPLMERDTSIVVGEVS